MKLFARFALALTALALVASQPARADVYGYIDENGLAHFAAERLDDRYVLFMKGAAVASKGDDKAKDDSAIALPATELPDADAYLNASKRDALDNAAGMRQRLVRAVLQHPNVPTVEPLIRQAASKHGIDPALVKAVIAAESGFNPQAVSPKGAIGLMQVIPDTGARYGVTGDARRTAAQKLADPKTNITTGVRYLSDLLRMSLQNIGAQEVALQSELEFLQRYVDIMRLRFGDRMSVVFDVAEETRDARVPNLLLQPLVENSFRHGFGDVGTGSVQIRIRRDGTMLRCDVLDDGRGLRAGHREGIGLTSTRERLRHLYGEQQSFSLQGAPMGRGVHVSMTMPFQPLERAAAD